MGAGGVGIPIPAADQTHESSLRIISPIVEQLEVALSKIPGFSEQVNTTQHKYPGGGAGAQINRGTDISGGWDTCRIEFPTMP